jgi:type IV pilus assembly protein PilQ
VLLDLSVSQDSPGAAVPGGVPINTRNVTTQVMVDNGETVVLGGVYTRGSSLAKNRVPFFGDLPYVGVLFRTTLMQDDKSELLIFVTPKIIKDSLQF